MAACSHGPICGPWQSSSTRSGTAATTTAGGRPLAGVGLALKLVTMHTQPNAWATSTFGAKWAKEGASPAADLANPYAVDAALDEAGSGRAKISDANSFLYLVRANQLFADGAAERIKAIKAPALIVYSPTDMVFPADSVK